MYPDDQTKISYKYLREVINHLDEPVCLLGGWAVYFIVNDLFEKERGYPYLGSRDIDLGFTNIASIKKVIKKLEKLGFRKVSFRYFKEIQSETLLELSEEEAKKTPLHNIFTIYVDLLMSKTEYSLKSELGFMPIVEPLLKYISSHHTQIERIGKNMILPSTALLLAMKTCSIKERNKKHKLVKDLCDIIGLCLYSGIEIETLKNKAKKHLNVKKIILNIDNENIKEAADILDIDPSIITNTVYKLKK